MKASYQKNLVKLTVERLCLRLGNDYEVDHSLIPVSGILEQQGLEVGDWFGMGLS